MSMNSWSLGLVAIILVAFSPFIIDFLKPGFLYAWEWSRTVAGVAAFVLLVAWLVVGFLFIGS